MEKEKRLCSKIKALEKKIQLEKHYFKPDMRCAYNVIIIKYFINDVANELALRISEPKKREKIMEIMKDVCLDLVIEQSQQLIKSNGTEFIDYPRLLMIWEKILEQTGRAADINLDDDQKTQTFFRQISERFLAYLESLSLAEKPGNDLYRTITEAECLTISGRTRKDLAREIERYQRLKIPIIVIGENEEITANPLEKTAENKSETSSAHTEQRYSLTRLDDNDYIRAEVEKILNTRNCSRPTLKGLDNLLNQIHLLTMVKTRHLSALEAYLKEKRLKKEVRQIIMKIFRASDLPEEYKD